MGAIAHLTPWTVIDRRLSHAGIFLKAELR